MSAQTKAIHRAGHLPLARDTAETFTLRAPTLATVRPARLPAIAEVAEDAVLLVLAVFAVPAIMLLVGSPIALSLRFVITIVRRFIG
jgi:hypothetical protein